MTRRPTVTRRSAVLALALVLPLVLGVVTLAALADRVEAIADVPAAVVNLDQLVTTGEGEDAQVVFAGRLLAGALTSPAGDAESSLDWTLTDAADAAAGLEDGTYYAVLTIPEDFSATLAGLQGDDPQQASVRVTSNDASSPLVGVVADQVAATAAAELGTVVTTSYLEGVYAGYGQVAEQLGQAADGADQLAGGAQQVDDGVRQLDSGAQQLAGGVGALASGADDLAGGVGELSAGAGSLAGGLGSLASGADELAGGTSRLASGASSLASGAQQLAGGTAQVSSGAAGLAAGLAQLQSQTAGLPDQTAALAAGAGGVATGATGVSDGLGALQAACLGAGAAPQFCAELDGVAAGAAQVAAGAQGTAAGAQALADGTPALAGGIASSAAGAQQLAGGAAQTASGAADLAAGAASLATGAGQLASGAGELADGAGAASSGASALASGAAQLDAGAGQLADGAAAASGGAAQLADGTGALADGTGGLVTGADQLAEGLSTGAEQVPTLTEAEAARRAAVVAEPVTAETSRINASPGGATDLAPLVVAIALWIGALAIALIRPALPADQIAAPVAAWRVAWRRYRGSALLGLVQAALVAAVLPLFGVSLASPVAAIALTGLGVLVFTAINQALAAAFGSRAGWMLSVGLLVVQVASLGGIVPIDTAPTVFQQLNAMLPMPLLVDGLSRLSLGGSVGSVGAAVTGLVLWGVLSFGVTVLAARRAQETSVARLRAELAA